MRAGLRIALAGAIVLAGCGGGNDADNASRTNTTAASTETTFERHTDGPGRILDRPSDAEDSANDSNGGVSDVAVGASGPDASVVSTQDGSAGTGTGTGSTDADKTTGAASAGSGVSSGGSTSGGSTAVNGNVVSNEANTSGGTNAPGGAKASGSSAGSSSATTVAGGGAATSSTGSGSGASTDAGAGNGSSATTVGSTGGSVGNAAGASTTVASVANGGPVLGDQEAADLLQVQLSDLGTGWSVGSAGESAFLGIDSCRPLLAAADVGSVARAESPTFVSGSTRAETAARIYATPDAAAAVLGAWNQSTVEACFAAAFGDLVNSTEIDAIETNVYRFTPPANVDKRIGYKVEIKTLANGIEETIFLNVVVLQKGRAVAQLGFQNPDTAFSGVNANVGVVAAKLATLAV